MAKTTIKITEKVLRDIINESVKRIISESDYMDDGDLESQYGKNPDAMWTYGTMLNPEMVDGMDPHSIRGSGKGDINRDNMASWDYFDAVSNGADMTMRNRANREYDKRINPRTPFGTSKEDYLNSRNIPNGDVFPGWADDAKMELDKKWNDQKERERYNQQADSRPLHRKGSLNRVENKNRETTKISESQLRNLIRESIKNILKNNK